MAIKYTLQIIIVLFALLFVAQSMSENQTRECIMHDYTSIDEICGNAGKRTQSCENAFYSLHVCLLNNECNKAEPNIEVFIVIYADAFIVLELLG